MTEVNFRFNQQFLDELKSMQTLLGTTDLKSTANLLLGLGALVVKEASAGGQVGIVNEQKDVWKPITHPALDNIKAILAEKNN